MAEKEINLSSTMSEKKSSTGFSSGSSNSNSASLLRVMQWNVLADGLAQFGDFVRVPKEVLEWSARAPKLLNKILEAAADIICLQELNHYDDYFLPKMQQHGYAGIFRPKRPSPATRYGCPADGSSVFYKASRLLLVREVEMKHGVIGRFKNLEADQELVVAATHLKAKTGKENDAIRMKQTQELLQKLTECTSGGALPSIVCGDFNTNPFSEVYKLVHEHSLRLRSVYARQHDGGNTSKWPRIEKGGNRDVGLEEEEEQQKVTAEDSETFYRISSGKSIDGGSEAEPSFTTWKFRSTGEKRQTIDYIWFSECPTLTPDKRWRLPTLACIGPDGLPSNVMPSDHLPLVCDFIWKSKENQDENQDSVEADLHYLNIPRICSTEVLVAINRDR